jgi:hypothetical protein
VLNSQFSEKVDLRYQAPNNWMQICGGMLKWEKRKGRRERTKILFTVSIYLFIYFTFFFAQHFETRFSRNQYQYSDAVGAALRKVGERVF